MLENIQKIGNFQIQSQLGEGEYTQVYLVRDIRNGERRALKLFLGPYQNDPMFQKRFKREFETVKKLSHPNLVKYYEAGLHKGYPYIVMEFLGKMTLQELLAYHGKASVEIAVAIIVQVLNGLIYLHEKGILHRDIKPSAVFIKSNGEVKLADFDIAKPIFESKNTDTITLKGDRPVGSPRYMSPEQRLGDNLSVRSDVFSVGVTFYELVTGQTPWQQEEYLRVDRRAWLNLTPPSKIINSPNKDIDQFVLTAIEFQPGRRFSSAEDMLLALERFSKAPLSDLADWSKGRKVQGLQETNTKSVQESSKRNLQEPRKKKEKTGYSIPLISGIFAFAGVIGACLLLFLLRAPIQNLIFPPTSTPTATPAPIVSVTPTPYIFAFTQDVSVINFVTGESFVIPKDSKIIIINPTHATCEVLADWNGTQVVVPAKVIFPDHTTCP